MRLVLAALVAALAACGTQEDPCAVPVGGVSLASAAASTLDVHDSALDCSGTADGVTLRCAGAVQVTPSSCTDGFALTLDSGNAKLLVHFAATNPWTAGAKLAGGASVAKDSDLTIAGLGPDPQPEPGATQSGAFDFIVDKAKLNGRFTITW